MYNKIIVFDFERIIYIKNIQDKTWHLGIYCIKLTDKINACMQKRRVCVCVCTYPRDQNNHFALSLQLQRAVWWLDLKPRLEVGVG